MSASKIAFCTPYIIVNLLSIGQEVVYRGCPDPSLRRADECSKGKRDGVYVDTCTCITSLCNEATFIKTAPIFLAGMSLLTLGVGWFN